MTNFYFPYIKSKIIFSYVGTSNPLASMTLASAENNTYESKRYPFDTYVCCRRHTLKFRMEQTVVHNKDWQVKHLKIANKNWCRYTLMLQTDHSFFQMWWTTLKIRPSWNCRIGICSMLLWFSQKHFISKTFVFFKYFCYQNHNEPIFVLKFYTFALVELERKRVKDIVSRRTTVCVALQIIWLSLFRGIIRVWDYFLQILLFNRTYNGQEKCFVITTQIS